MDEVEFYHGIDYARLRARFQQALQNVQKPILKGSIFNQNVLGGTNFFSDGLTPTNTPTAFKTYVTLNANVTLSVTRTRAEGTVTENLNAGVALTANALYTFDVGVSQGDTINFQAGGACTILSLLVVEMPLMVI